MKIRVNHWFTFAAVVAAITSSAVLSAAPTKLGTLTATKTVTVSSGGLSFPVNRSEQLIFDGDAIITPDGATAPVEFPNRGTVLVGSNTEAAFEDIDGVINVTLEKGGVRFSFNEGTPFVIQAKDQEITSSAAVLQKIAETTRQLSGVVAIDEAGEVYVLAETDGIFIHERDAVRMASTGVLLRFDSQENQFVQAQFGAGAVIGGATAGAGATAATLTTAAVLAGATVAGLTYDDWMQALEDGLGFEIDSANNAGTPSSDATPAS